MSREHVQRGRGIYYFDEVEGPYVFNVLESSPKDEEGDLGGNFNNLEDVILKRSGSVLGTLAKIWANLGESSKKKS